MESPAEMSNSGEIPAIKSPDWLPVGWTMEFKSRNGKNIKTYIHDKTGRKFYSKPKVLEYLRTGKKDNLSPQKETVESASDINLLKNSNEIPGSDLQGNGFHSGNTHEIGATEEMDAESSADWLPAGWTEEVKVKDGQTVKNYVDPLWGHRFSSKPQVLEYIEALTNNGCTSHKETPNVIYESNLPIKKMDTTKPLPDGWIIERKPRNSGTRAGYLDKVYIDPVTGRKFKSKQKVFEYLGIVNTNNSASQQKKKLNVDKTEGVTPQAQIVDSQNVKALDNGFNSTKTKERSCRMRLRGEPHLVEPQNVERLNETDNSIILEETGVSEQPQKKIRMEQLSPEGIPPGWIKEIKSQKFAHKRRNVSYFIDPVSGYVFTSAKDAWRYFESGDINKCKKRPKIKGETGLVSLPTETKNSPKPLPDGWIIEAKPRKFGFRAADKKYIDPVSRYVFTTLTDAWRYIEAGDISKCVKKPMKWGETGLATEQNSLPMRTMDSLKTLPDGWITKKKPRKLGSRGSNKQYIDPVSGYVFTTLRDAWRFIEAGNISKCVKKPKKRGEKTKMKIVSLAIIHKKEADTTEEPLSSDNNVGSKRSLETTDSDFSLKKRQRRSSDSAVTTDNTIVELHKRPSRISKQALNNKQAITTEGGISAKNDDILCLNLLDQPFQQFGEETWSNLDYTIETLKTDYDCSKLLDFDEPNDQNVSNFGGQSGSEGPTEFEPVTQSTTDPIFLPDMNCTLTSGNKAAPSKLKTRRMKRVNSP